MRRIFVIILTALFAVGVCGCDIFTSKSSSDKHLTTYFGAEHDVVAARFFVYPPDAEDYVVSYITVAYLEDANKDFWDRMEEFFPELEEYGEYVGYGW